MPNQRKTGLVMMSAYVDKKTCEDFDKASKQLNVNRADHLRLLVEKIVTKYRHDNQAEAYKHDGEGRKIKQQSKRQLTSQKP